MSSKTSLRTSSVVFNLDSNDEIDKMNELFEDSNNSIQEQSKKYHSPSTSCKTSHNGMTRSANGTPKSDKRNQFNSIVQIVPASPNNKRLEESDLSHSTERMPSQKEEVTVYAENVSRNLFCPVHGGLFTNPVIAKCGRNQNNLFLIRQGHTFCKNCISITAQVPWECPIDGVSLKVEDLQFLIPNLVVNDTIKGLKIYCKYGCKLEDGQWIKSMDGKSCPEIISLGNRNQHEEECTFATTKCPFSDFCPPICKIDLEEHLKVCSSIPCPHRKHGCDFFGNKDSVEKHLSKCAYESIKGYISKNKKKISKLKKRIKEKEEHNQELGTAVAQLTNTIQLMTQTLETKTNEFEITIRHMNAIMEATQQRLNESQKDIEALKQRSSARKKNRNNDDNLDIPVGMGMGIPMGLGIEYDQANLNCRGTFTGHSGPVWGLADGLLVSASSDMTIKIWDVANFKCKQTLLGHEGIVHAVVVHGNKLASGSSDKSIRIWDLETMQCVKIIKIHDSTVCSLATADGLLFSGSYTEIKVWDLETYKCIQTLTGYNHWVRALAAVDGRLYTGSYNIIKVGMYGTTLLKRQIWDLKSTPLQCLRTISGNYGSIYSLAVAPDCNKLLSGTYENKINVYDLESAKCIQSLGGHIGAVYTLAVAGNRFFSGSYDSTIKVWNIDNFKCLQTLVRHSSSGMLLSKDQTDLAVDALVVGPGPVIFSGSADNSVKVWR